MKLANLVFFAAAVQKNLKRGMYAFIQKRESAVLCCPRLTARFLVAHPRHRHNKQGRHSCRSRLAPRRARALVKDNKATAAGAAGAARAGREGPATATATGGRPQAYLR